MNFLPKALMLFLVLLLTASCWTTIPGAYASLAGHVVDRKKARYWPDIIDKISTISIPEGFSASDVVINLTLDPGGGVLQSDAENNTLTPVIKQIALSGTADLLVRYGLIVFQAP
jgi:hypothetical protein